MVFRPLVDLSCSAKFTEDTFEVWSQKYERRRGAHSSVEQVRPNELALNIDRAPQVERPVAADNDSVAVQDFAVQLALACPTLLGSQTALT